MRWRILVVDDDADIAEQTAESLRTVAVSSSDEMSDVDFETDFEIALRRLAIEHFDLLILDVRDVHYAAIRQPLDPRAFVDDLRSRMGEALTRLDQGIGGGTTGGVRITTRQGEPWISVPSLNRAAGAGQPGGPEGRGRPALGVLDLLDVLKEADFDAGFTEEFASVASREVTDRTVLRRRLLLVLFGLGTRPADLVVMSRGGRALPG